MPDIVSSRPVSGQPVATAWGDEIHDTIEGMQIGSVNVVLSASSVATTVLTFPRAYAAPPRVFLTIGNTNSAAYAHAWIGSAGITATTAAISAGRDDAGTNSATIAVQWLAIGTLATPGP